MGEHVGIGLGFGRDQERVRTNGRGLEREDTDETQGEGFGDMGRPSSSRGGGFGDALGARGDVSPRQQPEMFGLTGDEDVYVQRAVEMLLAEERERRGDEQGKKG
jgi:hypothetical protein